VEIAIAFVAAVVDGQNLIVEKHEANHEEVVMGLKVSKVEVWAATIEDRVGGLVHKLAPLSAAGANLEFVIARRAPEHPGKGVVFVAPLAGEEQVRGATDAGFLPADSLHSVRIEGPDRPGLGMMMAKALADAGVNLRGLSAAAIGRKFVCYLALDTADDAEKAVRTVKNLA
jgi:hypothetical protein